jgi:hypothetical protein
MKEREFIDLTNLVKTQDVLSLIRDIIADEKAVKSNEISEVVGVMEKWRTELQNKIKIKQ